ncbi:LCP family protein [Saccharopolyspora sp. NFXS83]|uniref:LCP family protein n=1 Tax=Saccharopolyspora sp. NFXS83 TaxID=2993560 RepID=UPI00224B40BE|nr:LCP family protein [Saccharopolyspora sp. NFXS83]MCX2732100.1 LCP family protein [Saccharopolyspora sp. NFXS83]
MDRARGQRRPSSPRRPGPSRLGEETTVRRPVVPRADDRDRRRPKRRAGRVFGRTLIALLSVAILSTSAYAWGTLNGWTGGITGSDVIGGGVSAPDGAVDVLLVGNDSRTDAEGNPLSEEVLRELRTTDESGNLTDTMILMRIPNGGERASAVSFPRDTQVSLGNGHGEHKLTEAYNTERMAALEQLESDGVTDPKEQERQARTAGQKFLIETIEDLSGVTIDHYAEVNLLGFYEITKAVGGVDVCLLNDVDDSEHSGAVFSAGPQTISGGDALSFVRQRYGLPRTDLDRVVRQQVFMSGLANKILSAGTLSNPVKLGELMAALRKSVVLDSGWDVMDFAQRMQGIAGGDIEFQTIPVELVGESGKEKVTVDEAEVQRFVANLLLSPQERAVRQQAERAPQEQTSQSETSSEEPTSESPSKTTVSVYNASGVTGLAASVLERLTGEGFRSGTSGNAESMSSSSVRVAAGEEAAGEQVAEALGGLPVRTSGSVESGSVEVYLGSDYEGPGAQNFAGARPLRLDGLQRAQAPTQPITAGGVPCVN